MTVAYATGFMLGLVVAAALDWWRRRVLRARVLDLSRKNLILNHDVWAACRERDDAQAERQRLYALLVDELTRELS